MRGRVPDHRGGRPCLSVHRRLSSLAWASPPPSDLLSPGSSWVCWTVSRQFPIRAGPRDAVIPSPSSSGSPHARCWPGRCRCPRSPSGPPTRRPRSSPRSAAGSASRLGPPLRPRPPSAGSSSASTVTPSTSRSAPGWPPGGLGPPGTGAAPLAGRGQQDRTRRPTRRWHAGPPARRDDRYGPGHRPSRGGRRDERNHSLPASARGARSGRHRGHLRRPALPDRPCPLPGGGQEGPLHCGDQRQPAATAPAVEAPALAGRAAAGQDPATAHDGDEIRRVKTCTVARGLAFPHAAQAVQIVRRRRTISTGRITLERIYAVTDLTADQADAPEIAQRVRDHWGI